MKMQYNWLREQTELIMTIDEYKENIKELQNYCKASELKLEFSGFARPAMGIKVINPPKIPYFRIIEEKTINGYLFKADTYISIDILDSENIRVNCYGCDKDINNFMEMVITSLNQARKESTDIIKDYINLTEGW